MKKALNNNSRAHSGKERREARTLAMEERGQACWHTRPMMPLHTSAGGGGAGRTH